MTFRGLICQPQEYSLARHATISKYIRENLKFFIRNLGYEPNPSELAKWGLKVSPKEILNHETLDAFC